MDVRVAPAAVLRRFLLSQKRQHPFHPCCLRGRADIGDGGAVEILRGSAPAGAQPAAHEKLKHGVAAVGKAKRADLVDLALVHGKGKVIIQERILRSDLSICI